MKNEMDDPSAGTPPEWFLEALEGAPPVEEARLQRYAHLLDLAEESFAAADAPKVKGVAKKATQRAVAPGMIVAVFTVAGKLVDWARDQVEGIERGIARSLESGLATRGVGHGAGDPSKPDSTEDTLEGGIVVTAGDVRVVLECHQDKKGPREKMAMVMKVVRADNTPVRPFEVTVNDGSGKEIKARKTYGVMDTARWPAPRAGVYVFEVRWAGGGAEVRVEVVA